LVHASALLTGTDSTGVVLADLRDPEVVLAQPKLRDLIDFTQPVALLLVAILHFITDAEGPAAIVATLRDALPGGSYLALSHGTQDFHPPGDADRPRPPTRTPPPGSCSAPVRTCARSSTASTS